MKREDMLKSLYGYLVCKGYPLKSDIITHYMGLDTYTSFGPDLLQEQSQIGSKLRVLVDGLDVESWPVPELLVVSQFVGTFEEPKDTRYVILKFKIEGETLYIGKEDCEEWVYCYIDTLMGLQDQRGSDYYLEMWG